MKKQDEVFETNPDDYSPTEHKVGCLACVGNELKPTKDGQRIEIKITGMTTARFITDLCNDDYLIGVAELLIDLCSNDDQKAKSWIDTIEAECEIKDLVDAMTGANNIKVKGGFISMKYSTLMDLAIDGVIVDKYKLIRPIAKWLVMLAKGNYSKCYSAISDGYLRIVNRDNIISFEKVP